jgi:hypothetical protein
MAFDTEVKDLLVLEGVSGLRTGSRLTDTLDRNLVQGLGVVNTTLIQTHGGTADDAATMAALRTAVWIPAAQQGHPALNKS